MTSIGLLNNLIINNEHMKYKEISHLSELRAVISGTDIAILKGMFAKPFLNYNSSVQ